MNILALDTSGSAATAAVSTDGYMTGELTIRNGRTHSQKVIPMVESLLAMLDLKMIDINLLAVANGPGSFTGLRIGVVTMKAFAYALKIPLIEVPTLMALACTLGETDGMVCPIMDARNRQVFTGIYRIDGDTVSVCHQDCAIHIEQLAEIVKSLNTPVRFVGDAVPIHKVFLMEQQIAASFAPDEIFTHRAASVARLAMFMHRQGVEADAFSAVPNYLRKSQAERMKGSLSGEKTDG
ncbi:MAG: tRNA (adenosine(37)-N6)-threonylcarbamoyltransferase complex dimerization subunit type 1 TsaB [Ruminiclostridium sp.]|nr:tRNA (adenosine(37)-N6)-threonylcarbamoyltransferase complex dimerization subunit type 1 TsaB [Ruminiclostridium sp.]